MGNRGKQGKYEKNARFAVAYFICANDKFPMSSPSSHQRISVLKDNPPLPGKKFFLASMISPEGRQKGKVYGFKLHDMCETEEEGKMLCEYYHKLDPDFDVYLGTVGKWSPWVFDPLDVGNVEYADKFMTQLLGEHRSSKRDMDVKWRHEVDQNMEHIRRGATKEGQQEMSNRKEPAVSLWFKIQQLENTIKRRKNEQEALEEIFHTKYTKAERMEAKKAKLPLSEPAPMQYELLGSDPGSSSSSSGPSSSAGPSPSVGSETLPDPLSRESEEKGKGKETVYFDLPIEQQPAAP